MITLAIYSGGYGNNMRVVSFFFYYFSYYSTILVQSIAFPYVCVFFSY